MINQPHSLTGPVRLLPVMIAVLALGLGAYLSSALADDVRGRPGVAEISSPLSPPPPPPSPMARFFGMEYGHGTNFGAALGSLLPPLLPLTLGGEVMPQMTMRSEDEDRLWRTTLVLGGIFNFREPVPDRSSDPPPKTMVKSVKTERTSSGDRIQNRLWDILLQRRGRNLAPPPGPSALIQQFDYPFPTPRDRDFKVYCEAAPSPFFGDREVILVVVKWKEPDARAASGAAKDEDTAAVPAARVLARNLTTRLEFNPGRVLTFRALDATNANWRETEYTTRASQRRIPEVREGDTHVALYEVILKDNSDGSAIVEVTLNFTDPVSGAIGSARSFCRDEDLHPVFKAGSFGYRQGVCLAEIAELIHGGAAARKVDIKQLIASWQNLAPAGSHDPSRDTIELFLTHIAPR